MQEGCDETLIFVTAPKLIFFFQIEIMNFLQRGSITVDFEKAQVQFEVGNEDFKNCDIACIVSLLLIFFKEIGSRQQVHEPKNKLKCTVMHCKPLIRYIWKPWTSDKTIRP